jgi:hypothetical protein
VFFVHDSDNAIDICRVFWYNDAILKDWDLAMTERTFTQSQLLEAAQNMRNGSSYAQSIKAVIKEIVRLEEADRIARLEPPRPSVVPDGFRKICVCSRGINRGIYTIEKGDRHIWLPVDEARKERPDLATGIWAEDIQKAS